MNIRKLKFLQPHVSVVSGRVRCHFATKNVVSNHQHMDANSTPVHIILCKFNNFAIWICVLVMIFITSTILEVRTAINKT